MFRRFPTFFLFLLGIIFLAGCIDSNPEPPPVCEEQWFCDPWNTCTDGFQSRICTEKNNCLNPQFRPPLTQTCTPDVIPPADNDFPVVVNMGAEETVFDYQRDACAELDLPDVYAHAIRDAQNNIVLVSGNAPDNYFMFGTNFNNLKRSCTPVLRSGDQWPVETFDHQEWITSAYTEDGQTIHALVHNEYHDPFSPICKPGDTQPSNLCWYNFVSYARSTDGGRTFTQPTSPNHLVAIPPFQWDANSGGLNRNGFPMRPPAQGYMEPSNIVKRDDGYYYAMVRMLLNTKPGKDTVCVMRTNNLNDPSTWKFWDGDSYAIPLTNPYPVEPANASDYICHPVSYETIGSLHGSLTYNTYLQRFMNVGAGVYADDAGKLTCGFWYSLSADLITWGKPRLLYETVLGWPPCNNPTPAQQALSIDQEAYPSIIDHDSTSQNFETADNTVYLYWMQNQDNHNAGGWGLRRNLVRVPVTFTK